MHNILLKDANKERKRSAILLLSEVDVLTEIVLVSLADARRQHCMRFPCAEAPVGLEAGGEALRIVAVVRAVLVHLLHANPAATGRE